MNFQNAPLPIIQFSWKRLKGKKKKKRKALLKSTEYFPTAQWSKNWFISLYFSIKVYLLFSQSASFFFSPQWLLKVEGKFTSFFQWWKSAYLWGAGIGALIKCRGRPITGSVITLEWGSNFGQCRVAIHHWGNREPVWEINNKCISQCLDVTGALLGHAGKSKFQNKLSWSATDLAEKLFCNMQLEKIQGLKMLELF